MHLVLYASVSDEVVEQVRKALEPSFKLASFRVHRTISGLSESLHPPVKDVRAVVLLVGKREDILELIGVRYLFRHVPVVLVLPDTDDQTIALAHRLRPRYLTYIDAHFVDLYPVLARLFERHEERQAV